MLLYSLLYHYLFIIFKENATFKLHFVLIVLPCKQQNVTYIGFLNYMHLPLICDISDSADNRQKLAG